MWFKNQWKYVLCYWHIVKFYSAAIHRKLEREKDRISLAVSVISKLGGMPTSTQIANWAFEEADETMVSFLSNYK